MIKILIGQYFVPDCDGFEFHEDDYITKLFGTKIDWLFENIENTRFILRKEHSQVWNEYVDMSTICKVTVEFKFDEDAVFYKMSVG